MTSNMQRTKKTRELVVILGENKHTIIKVKNQKMTKHTPPFFIYKNGVYWRYKPIPIGNNRLHIYHKGISYPINRLGVTFK